MEHLAAASQWFISLFEEGGKNFVGMLTGIIPTLVCLMTAVNALTNLIGKERVERFMRKISRWTITRYTIMPVLAVIFITNPMCYSFGRFLDEKYKPAFYDAAVSFVHPVLGLFPHANGAELFVYLGIANGYAELGLGLGNLAVRYFLVGIVVIFIRGLLTEKITLRMLRAKESQAALSKEGQ